MSEAPQSSRLAILIPFGVVTLIWGSTWIVIRDQIGVVPASWSVSYRFLIAGAALALYARVRGERFRFDAAGWGIAVILAALQFCANFNLVYRAEAHITSGLVAVVFALLLVPNALLARIFLGQRLGRQLLVGSAIAICGVTLLFIQQARVDANGPAAVLMGVALTLAAVLSASIGNVLQASAAAKRNPMIALLAVAMVLGSAIDALLASLLDGAPVIEWRLAYWLGLAYLSLIASAVAFTLYFRVLRVIGPAKAAYSSVLVPVIAMLLSTLFEDYRWSLLAATGAALVLAGLVLALRARRPNR